MAQADDKFSPPHSGPLPEGEGGIGRFALPVYTIFFVSGAAALTYEISWSRQIGLLLGNTASAAATVLASYFIGLALGYALAGRFAHRAKRPLLAYGAMELIAAAWAILVPLLITLLEEGQLASMLHHASPAVRTTMRALLCVLLFLPATTALGATLPLMVRWLESAPGGSGGRIAWAYGLNTFGGLVGVLLATIVLLSQVGVVASSVLAAAASTFCGVIAIGIAVYAGQSDSPTSESTDSLHKLKRQSKKYSFLKLLILVAISGFLTLALEVLYTRLFALTFHNSTYTFGLVVAVVLFGLAAGAWAAAWLHRYGDAAQLAGWAFLLAGGAVSLSALLFLNQTGLSYFRGGASFANYMAASVGLVAIVVFIPALLLGMVLPLLWDAATIATRTVSTSAVVGRLTAVNTLSAAAGALAASFFMLPVLGLWSSFALVACCCMAASAVLAAERSLTYWATTIAMGCLTIAAWHVTSTQTTVPPGKALVSRAEGTYGWIDVLKDNRSGALSLRENINYTHGSTASATWERRQSHIPLLLHPAPQDVLYLGSGTGATAGGAVMHNEVESIVIAELIPEVVDAARQFKKSNLAVFDDPRTEVHIDDARHYLLATDRKFDVIIADLFVPWESKTGYLYTVDHYAVARSRLKPGGLFCHWLPMWQLGEEEFEMIVDSFASVFPNTTLWWGKIEYDRSIIGLVGSDEPLEIDNRDIDARIQSLSVAGPEDIRLNRPIELARRYIGDWPARPNTILNTDEHPRLEFAMPLTYANHDTLKFSSMQAYYDETLAKLPTDGVVFHSFEPESVSTETRQQWQRLQLRK